MLQDLSKRRKVNNKTIESIRKGASSVGHTHLHSASSQQDHREAPAPEKNPKSIAKELADCLDINKNFSKRDCSLPEHFTLYQEKEAELLGMIQAVPLTTSQESVRAATKHSNSSTTNAKAVDVQEMYAKLRDIPVVNFGKETSRQTARRNRDLPLESAPMEIPTYRKALRLGNGGPVILDDHVKEMVRRNVHEQL